MREKERKGGEEEAGRQSGRDADCEGIALQCMVPKRGLRLWGHRHHGGFNKGPELFLAVEHRLLRIFTNCDISCFTLTFHAQVGVNFTQVVSR